MIDESNLIVRMWYQLAYVDTVVAVRPKVDGGKGSGRSAEDPKRRGENGLWGGAEESGRGVGERCVVGGWMVGMTLLWRQKARC